MKEFFLTYYNCWGCCHFDSFFYITSQVWGFIISFQLVITRLIKMWTFLKNCNYVKYDLEPLNLSLRESTAEGVGLSHIWALHLCFSLFLSLSRQRRRSVEVFNCPSVNNRLSHTQSWLIFQVPPWFPVILYVFKHSSLVYLLFYCYIL